MTDQAVQAEATAIASRLENFAAILREITVERAMQDAQWGGPAHDDMNPPDEWLVFIGEQMNKVIRDRDLNYGASEAITTRMARARLIKIAALAVAGCQSIDRLLPAMEGGVR